MIAARHVRPPVASELRACALAAVAEAGVVYLPASLLLSEAGVLDVGIGVAAAPFFLAFVGGTLLACRARATANLAASAGVVAVLLGLALGRGNPAATSFAAVIVLLVEIRVLTLALRDWGTPVEAEIAWGAAALGAETMLAAAAVPEWEPLLLAFVPVFFGAALASRATTVWTSALAGDLDTETRTSWVRRSMLATGALGVAMALAVLVSVRGGLFDLLGRLIRPVAFVAISVLVWVVALAARPLLWLAERIGVDPDAVRELFDRLRASATNGVRDAREVPSSGGSGWGRLLGLAVLLAVGVVVFRLMRRRSRKEPETDRPAVARGGAASRPVAVEPTPAPRSRFRRELPADVVRRSYAEVLLALREHHLAKGPALTPGEFVPEVAVALPEGGDDFRALTRAYEDVRYGGRRLGRGDVRRVDASRRRLLALLQRRHGRRLS